MIRLREIHPGFAAEVDGADLRRLPSAADVAEFEAAIALFPVLVLRGQDLTDEQHIAFTRPFGDLQQSTEYLTAKGEFRLPPLMTDASNIGRDSRTFGAGDARRMSNLGSRRWHTDGSFRMRPVKYSLLAARTVAKEGGETQFADMRAAYDMLDAKMKARIEGLVCEHSRIFSKGALGIPFTEAELKAFAPVRQRLVRTHRKTGRKSLFLSSHAGRILGWPAPEAQILLRELTEHATQREFVYSHKWQVGDLVMWDNRTTMHRARPYEDSVYPRDLRRTTVTDGVPTVDQQLAA